MGNSWRSLQRAQRDISVRSKLLSSLPYFLSLLSCLPSILSILFFYLKDFLFLISFSLFISATEPRKKEARATLPEIENQKLPKLLSWEQCKQVCLNFDRPAGVTYLPRSHSESEGSTRQQRPRESWCQRMATPELQNEGQEIVNQRTKFGLVAGNLSAANRMIQ